MMDRTLKLMLDMMDIPSVSEDEYAIGVFLEEKLLALGYNVQRIPISPGSTRCNVYAYLGASPTARICLSSHMDTVPPHIPASIANNIVYGRGACDDKGPLAAQITAVEELRKENLIRDGDVSLLFVVGEEKGGPGMIAANDMNLTWEAIIFGEPTESKLAVGHKGHFVFELDCKGVASHSGYPHKGRSANREMLQVLGELEDLTFPKSDLLGETTYHCARIHGGVAYNVISANCCAECGVRVAAGLPTIQDLVRKTVAKYPNVTLTEKFAYGETLLDHDVPGIEHTAVSFGTDVPRLRGNHKRYLYGPGSIDHAHGENEQIRIDDLIASVQVYKTLALHCLGRQRSA